MIENDKDYYNFNYGFLSALKAIRDGTMGRFNLGFFQRRKLNQAIKYHEIMLEYSRKSIMKEMKDET